MHCIWRSILWWTNSLTWSSSLEAKNLRYREEIIGYILDNFKQIESQGKEYTSAKNKYFKETSKIISKLMDIKEI